MTLIEYMVDEERTIRTTTAMMINYWAKIDRTYTRFIFLTNSFYQLSIEERQRATITNRSIPLRRAYQVKDVMSQSSYLSLLRLHFLVQAMHLILSLSLHIHAQTRLLLAQGNFLFESMLLSSTSSHPFRLYALPSLSSSSSMLPLSSSKMIRFQWETEQAYVHRLIVPIFLDKKRIRREESSRSIEERCAKSDDIVLCICYESKLESC